MDSLTILLPAIIKTKKVYLLYCMIVHSVKNILVIVMEGGKRIPVFGQWALTSVIFFPSNAHSFVQVFCFDLDICGLVKLYKCQNSCKTTSRYFNYICNL